jgi:hypothetical protein
METTQPIRADQAARYLDDVYLPGLRGVYRAASHDRADRADFVLFIDLKGQHIYVPGNMIVSKRIIDQTTQS